MKTNYSAEISQDEIVITGSIPLSDLNDLVFFIENRLGDNCEMLIKHTLDRDKILFRRKSQIEDDNK